MPFGWSPLVRAATALLAVAGVLVLAPPRLARACVPAPGPAPIPPPAGTVAFSGTLVDARAVPGTSPQGIGQVYTFAVDDVFLGVVGPQAVVVDLDAAVPFTDRRVVLPCGGRDPAPAYLSFIADRPDPVDGQLLLPAEGTIGVGRLLAPVVRSEARDERLEVVGVHRAAQPFEHRRWCGFGDA